MRTLLIIFVCITSLLGLIACQTPETKAPSKATYRSWNILSSHIPNGLRTLDSAAAWGVNQIELSHYQLCHDLKDLKNPKNLAATLTLIDAAHERGIEKAYVWDHAFYRVDYYPERFRVNEGTQLNLDDPEFWQWVYQDYDSLLALVPNLDGIILTFIETGAYVTKQHSEVLQTDGQKIAALVDSLGKHFIDRHGLELTIRTFIYNQFEKEGILESLQLIHRKDLKVMIKMVPHDWFLTYPYQDYVADIPFPVVIEYDCGMEYAGENIILNTFADYFVDAYRHYAQYDHVIGYAARSDRFETTAAIGTPGELNLWLLAQCAAGNTQDTDIMVMDYLRQKYGAEAAPLILPAFQSAFDFVASSLYTLSTHTANHSRLNYHRNTIYQSHTTGEWFPPSEQEIYVGHGVDRSFHFFKDILNVLSFPQYKRSSEPKMQSDLAFVVDSMWLDTLERMDQSYLEYIIKEKDYSVDLAEKAFEQIQKALPLIKDSIARDMLFHTLNRTVIVAKERRGAAKAVYGYRLWSRGQEYQSPELQELICEGLSETEAMLTEIDNYPIPVALGQWRWTRDREAFEIYKRAILETGWEAFGLGGVTVPCP